MRRTLLSRAVNRVVGRTPANVARDRLRSAIKSDKAAIKKWAEELRQRELRAQAIEPEVVEGPGFKEAPRQSTRIQGLEVLYRLPSIAINPERLAFVSRGADGVVWCMVALLPSDSLYLERYPEGVRRLDEQGRDVVRRGFALAIAGAAEGAGPGTWRKRRG